MWGSKNHNCLEGMACPKCGSDGPFSIVSSCVVTWTDDGTEDEHDFEFDDDSNCRCCQCMYSAEVSDFKNAAALAGALPVRIIKGKEKCDA